MARYVGGAFFAVMLAGCGTTSDPGENPDEAPRGSLVCEDIPEVGDPPAREAVAGDPTVALLADGIAALGGDLLDGLADEGPLDANGALSALSLVGMFSVLLPATDATVSESLRDVLRIEQDEAAHHLALSGLLEELADPERGWGFDWGAGFWHRDQDPQASWLDDVGPLYGVQPEILDFQGDPTGARETLNTWVEDHTRCLIPEFYPEGYDFSRTVHIAIHAMALEALWETPLDDGTYDRPFQLAGGDTVEVSTMRKDWFSGSSEEVSLGGEPATVVRLPYKGGDLAMYVAMPHTPAAPEALIASRDEALEAVATHHDDGLTLTLSLPRWSTNVSHDLIPVLDGLGYGALMSTSLPDLCADCALPDIIRQVVVVEVDEEGTRAAAVTAGETNDSAPEVYVSVDRPFLWFLVDEPSGTVLWEGWVSDPSE